MLSFATILQNQSYDNDLGQSYESPIAPLFRCATTPNRIDRRTHRREARSESGTAIAAPNAESDIVGPKIYREEI
jgi:hypothetical protein